MIRTSFLGVAALALTAPAYAQSHLVLGLSGLLAVNFVPGPLAPLYGGHSPTGVMGFARLKLD